MTSVDSRAIASSAPDVGLQNSLHTRRSFNLERLDQSPLSAATMASKVLTQDPVSDRRQNTFISDKGRCKMLKLTVPTSARRKSLFMWVHLFSAAMSQHAPRR